MPLNESEYLFSIRLRDTDAAGVLYFSRLLDHAHDAYEALMDDIGQPLQAMLDGAVVHLPLVHAEADYLAPLRLGDRIRVRVRLDKLGRSSFTLAYAFIADSGLEAARAATVHVAIRPDTGEPMALPSDLAQALGNLVRTATGGGDGTLSP